MDSQMMPPIPNAPRTKGADEKFCGSCGEAIKIQAEICPKCGVRQRTPLNKTALVLLTFFLGGLGVHKFYLGKYVQGVFYLLFCWTFIPGLIALVEFFIYAFTSSETLDKRYSGTRKGGGGIVVAIIAAVFGFIILAGILAAVAIPKFMDASNKAKASEFPSELTAIYTGEMAYNAENGRYTASLATLRDSSGVDVPSESKWFTYSLDATKSSFTGHATVKTLFGQAKIGDEATINQNNEKNASASLMKYVPSWR
jgi:TM2 domain-containing membrane protein YozV/type II secretory pathway pseudopilin PulG